MLILAITRCSDSRAGVGKSGLGWGVDADADAEMDGDREMGFKSVAYEDVGAGDKPLFLGTDVDVDVEADGEGDGESDGEGDVETKEDAYSERDGSVPVQPAALPFPNAQLAGHRSVKPVFRAVPFQSEERTWSSKSSTAGISQESGCRCGGERSCEAKQRD